MAGKTGPTRGRRGEAVRTAAASEQKAAQPGLAESKPPAQPPAVPAPYRVSAPCSSIACAASRTPILPEWKFSPPCI